ncbi:eCIS core domain-containing protein [Tenacibaculum jejuense]|uniref:eCIS core domain-containing protein n=1 Tax=Tenacibaculum jejuense TaxID=584609 RepID=A0A238UCM6_9FLAO|nr:DUF4157 domain-containing protein [Tenacibaculum jejuense]SNR16919.1 protein of unknown function [Tenacibaculum jejuense]
MKTKETTQEVKKDTVQRVQKETSTGGNATIVNNRPETSYQRKAKDAMQRTTVKSPVIQQKNTRPELSRRNNTGLPNNLKLGIENLSGYSMDDVKVHYNSSKPAQLQAHAYAQGTDIHLAPGQEKHLPHEAWHVVQQKQGRVKPTRQLKSKVNINDDAGLEKEADVMGARAIQTENINIESLIYSKQSTQNNQLVQRYVYENNDGNDIAYDPNNNNVTGYQPLNAVVRVASKGILRRVLKASEPTIDESERHFISNELWNRFGNNQNDHINMRLVSQIVKDFKKNKMHLTFHSFKSFLDSYLDIRETSLINRDSDTLILGKYVPTVQGGLDDWWFRGPGSYIQLARDNDGMYFNMGNRWDELIQSNKYDLTDSDLFNLFNTYVLDYAVERNVEIVFVDHPEEYRGSALYDEWIYLQERHGYKSLYANGEGEYIASIV